MRYWHLLLMLFAVSVAYADELPGAVESAASSHLDEKEADISLEDIRTFTSVFNLVKQAYVEEVDDHALMQAAIHGLLAGLDPHSDYLEKRQLDELLEDTSGSYAGVGIEVMIMDGTLRVISPIDDTPAARGGIKAGDVILRIDGKAIQAEGADDAVEYLRGKPGTEVTLTVLHDKQTLPVDIKLTREVIRVASVRGRFLEPGYIYLRISQFQTETGTEIKRELEHLRKSPHAALLKGAILDLRSNPGGLLTSAVEVSDAFLDEGIIVSTRGRLKEADLSFRATAGDLLNGISMVVLVDNGTASAAEIVAGALKDHHRAILMGRRTFGKGSVQTVLPIDESHAVKLTTARYYTPNGISIQAQGIHPDIPLADLTFSARELSPLSNVSERDLPRHLKGDGEGKGIDSADDATLRVDASDEDYALNAALNVLKAMTLEP